jgi:hypothetical protein
MTTISSGTQLAGRYRCAAAWNAILGRAKLQEDITRYAWHTFANGDITAPDTLALAQVGNMDLATYQAVIVAYNMTNWPHPSFRAQTESLTDLRAELIGDLWSGEGLPTGAVTVDDNVAFPMANPEHLPTNLLQTDALSIPLIHDGDTVDTVEGYMFWPTSGTTNNKLVVSPGTRGHSTAGWDDDSSTVLQLIYELVEAGYTVAAVEMPFGGTTALHNVLPYPTRAAQYLRFFLEPAVRLVNQFSGDFDNTCAFGFSGSGCEASKLAAIDTRIDASVAVAGSLPLYFAESGRDFEQELPSTSFEFCDFYAMAASGSRPHAHYINDEDTCCFKASTFNAGTSHVSAVQAVSPTYTFEIVSNNDHSIHADVRADIITLFDGV